MILVTGATGNNGREVVKQLSALGADVRAMVRNGDSAAALLEGPHVQVVEGDFEKPDTLVAALDGVTSAFLLAPGVQNCVELQSNFVAAAKQTGLPHLVKFSVAGADLISPLRFGRWHAQTEQEIRESGIPFTFLQPNYFMQNFSAFSAQTIAQQGCIYAPMGDGRVSFVDVRDNAAVAARTLIETGHVGNTYVITGPEAISFSQAAATLSAVLGKTVTFVDITLEQSKQAMLGVGMPEWLADAMNEIYATFSAGYGAGVTDTVAKIGKKEPISFEKFARDYQAVFSAG
ncbi:MAG: SDR family oxidoreductase [Capsulimonadaceae bacterium]